MTRRVRLACQVALCGLFMLALHALWAEAAGNEFGHGSFCNGRCVCAPNAKAKEFGYAHPIWRTWPGEVRPDVTFPGSVGSTVIPTPPGRKQQPLPKETVPPGGQDLYPPPGGMPGGNILGPGGFNIEGSPPILPTPDIDEPSLDPILPGGIIPGMPAEPPLIGPGGIDFPIDLPEGADTGATPDDGETTPAATPPAGEPSAEPAAPPSGDGTQLPGMLPDLVAHKPIGSVPGTGQPADRQPLPAAPGQRLKEPDAVPAHSMAVPDEPLPAHVEPVLAEPQPLPPGSESALAQPQLLPPEIGPAPAEPQPPAPGLELPEGGRQPLPATPGPSLAPPELFPGGATPQRRMAKSLQANWTAALHPGRRGDSGPSRSVYPARPATTVAHQTAVASGTELDINGIGHEIPVAPDTYAGDSPPVALDGFCPVALVGSESWTPGDPRWSAVYDGRTYLFSGETQLRSFQNDPQRFAPALSGQDPVLLVDGNRRVPGRTDYCATYKGRLYMFSSSVTLTRFRKTPSRYAEGRGK